MFFTDLSRALLLKVEASDGTEAFNLLVAAVNSADERVRFNFSSPSELFLYQNLFLYHNHRRINFANSP